MLVLTRKESESITLNLPDGEKITVTLKKIRGSQVQIGIEAEQVIKIWRTELKK